MTAGGLTGAMAQGAKNAGVSEGSAGLKPTRDLNDSARHLTAALDQAKQAQAAQTNPAAAEAEAKERAKRALHLDDAQQPATAAGAGDTILDGLQKLRGAFDAQQARVNKAMAAPATDMHTLLAIQMEVVNYSVLIDVTSKLTGKSTQAFETLLKGQ
jgi:type III secretion system YscI/HrpB-like protein